MKKILFAILTVALISITTHSANAKASKMIFWYPGEAGSTSEAAPLLEEFSNYVKKKSGIELEGTYINDVSKGIVFIKKQKPAFGIISHITLEENRTTLPPPFTTVAWTKPLPDGKTTEQFSLVGYRVPESEETWTPPTNLTVLTSIPISIAYLKSTLFPNLTGNIMVKMTNTILMTLKKMSTEANPNQVALLTPMESYALKSMSAEWTTKLAELVKSKSIPTAALVSFQDDPRKADTLVKTLIDMSNDPEGKEILETLRLKGFAK